MFGLEFIRSTFLQKAAHFNFAQFVGMGRTRSMPRDARAFAREGYSQNVINFRCVDLIAKGLASIPIKVKKKDKEDPDHPLQSLLNKPNLKQSGDTFIEEFVDYRLITGNSYIDVIRDGTGLPRELTVWQPYQFKIAEHNHPNVLPIGYVWEQGRVRRTWDIDELTGESELLHWKTFHPFNQWFGMSPIEAAAYAIDQFNAASEWNLRMLQNDASPSGVLEVEMPLDETQYQRLKKDIENNYGGSQNAKKPMLLEGGMKWNQISLNPKEMDFIKGFNLSGQQIAAAYGVPLQVIPIPGSQTFANFAEARLALWEDTILPLGENMIEALMEWLRPFYEDGDDLKLVFDLDEIPALAPRRQVKFETANNNTFMTTNQKRALVGMDPYDLVAALKNPADEIFMGSGLMPLSDMMNEDAGMEEDPPKPEEEEEEEDDTGAGGDDEEDEDEDEEDEDA